MSPSSSPPFPLYLLPSLPFRRRTSSSTTTTSSSPSSSLPSSPASSSSPHPTSSLHHFPTSSLHCTKCLTPLLPTTHIISKSFTGRHGRAYLCSPSYPSSTSSASLDVPNTHTHKPVSRQLVTGAHTVSDISCTICGTVLGWKYNAAQEEGQRYKVGKVILEAKRVVRIGSWEGEWGDVDVEANGGGGIYSGEGKASDDVEFDSQDEDECEELFGGIWSADGARRRRAGGIGR